MTTGCPRCHKLIKDGEGFVVQGGIVCSDCVSDIKSMKSRFRPILGESACCCTWFTLTYGVREKPAHWSWTK